VILAQPLTIYLGTADTVQDKYFGKGGAATGEGESRYERGKKGFALAQELAKKNGWKCGWRLVEAPMIGHDAKSRFHHLNCDEALALRVAATRMQF